MTILRVLTQDLGGSALSRLVRAGGTVGRGWYVSPPSGPAAWRERALSVAASVPDWWSRLETAFAAEGIARQRLQRVAAAGGVVVTTGQQPGLFGGPLYTLSKALSALTLADAIELETGVPAAPVFWAATDDADFEEASVAVLAVTGGTETLRLTAPPPSGTPMTGAPLGDVEAFLARLADASGSAVAPEYLRFVRSSYGSENTVGGAYLALMRAVLQPLGIGVIDASHPAVRKAGGALLRRALERGTDVEGTLERRAADIEAAGFRPQVEHVRGLSLVFVVEDGVKRRIPLTEASSFLARGEAAELSPNVLLRPVLERAILPTVAYLAGPGELAYFAQVSAVAAALGVDQPVALPRWSGTIVEPRIERLLQRLHVLPDELRDPHAVEGRLARAVMPAPVTEAARALRRDVERDIAALERADEDSLVPAAVLQGLRRSILHRLDRLERRYAAAVKRRETQLMRDVATTRASLFPDGKPQERVLAFAPFLVRYGAPLLDEMIAQAAVHAGELVHARSAVPNEAGRPATRA
jgi:bacillithiol biosynthesis cysteine-adding enzyme BshC